MVGLLGLSVSALFAAPVAVRAQSPDSPTSVFDAYGNARGFNLDRRSVGNFQNDVQQQALRGFQDQGRRERQRGGINPFILPGDVQLFRPPPATKSLNELFPGALTAATARKSYALYGGFEPRSQPSEQGGEAMTALLRRRMLIEATTVNAPIHRSLSRNASVYALRLAIEQTPFDANQTVDDRKPPRTIEEGLRHGVEEAYERTRTDAWGWFREGEYRRAARAFETAAMLNRADGAAVIGEIVSHWSLSPETPRTAAVVLGQLMRRGGNPFAYDVNLADAYPDRRTAQTMSIQARLQAAPEEVSVHLAALDALVLWYLGERNEALLVAEKIARRTDGSDYADWLAKMREVMSTPPADGK